MGTLLEAIGIVLETYFEFGFPNRSPVGDSLSRASHIGMTRVQLETDASNLRKALTSECLDNSPEGALFRQIRVMMSNNFVSCSISICPRICNRVADGLANHGVAISPDEGDVFWYQAPSFVTDLVSGDLPGADSL